MHFERGKQNDPFLYNWDLCDSKHRTFLKVSDLFYRYETRRHVSACLENVCNAFLRAALSSDNHMVCFRR
jgi:hypothetical protein